MKSWWPLLLLLGCSGSQTQPYDPPAGDHRIGVYCPGPFGACHARAERDCYQSYHTTLYQVVGKVPGRSVLLVSCGASDESR